MKSYKVEFKLKTPLCLNSPFLSLDGILMYLKAQQEIGDKVFYENSKKQEFDDFGLPIKHNDKHGFYYASTAIFDFERKVVEEIYARPNCSYLTQLYDEDKNLGFKRGARRQFVIQLTVVPTKDIKFYFESNNVNEIENLLNNLEALGKKTSIGFGLIDNYEISKAKGSSVISEGRTLRFLPEKFFLEKGIDTDGTKTTASIKPPYWLNETKDVYLPFTKVKPL